MQEYLSEAIVLDRLPNGDLDGRIVFLTRRFGKLIGKAKSIKKITSKLSGHLQPGNVVQVRLVEKNGLQVVDALKKSRLEFSPAELHFLGEILADSEPEFTIWEMLVGNNFSWEKVLRILGWDPSFASCAACGGQAESFHSRTQEFFCKDCASKLRPGEVIY
ncbi:MAG: recombination protein O N-terminal domain-containing protein, partial [Candidatus Liptonbacteria bacterium]|nr:recombination protein O N-terminal domain-containing protein [Candidatus Liptonbacteria bacterium]